MLRPSWGHLEAIFAFLEPVLGIPGALAAANERTNDILRKSASRLDETPKNAPRGPPWSLLGPSDGHLAAPRWPQDSPKMAQDGPKMAPYRPKITFKPRKRHKENQYLCSWTAFWPQAAPKWPKMAPRWPKMAPGWPKMAPRWPQDGPRLPQG